MKEPWQMTRVEYLNTMPKRLRGAVAWEGEHETYVKNAISIGKPVPPEVLKDYPELAKQAPQASELATQEPGQPQAKPNYSLLHKRESASKATEEELLKELNSSKSRLLALQDSKYKSELDRQTRPNDISYYKESIDVIEKELANRKSSTIKQHDIITDGLVRGEVLGEGKYQFGRMTIEGYKIHIISGHESGKTSFIAKTEARLVKSSQDYRMAERLEKRYPFNSSELNLREKKRSKRSQSMDETRSNKDTIRLGNARIKRWYKDPGSMDVQGIDTPRRRMGSRGMPRTGRG